MVGVNATDGHARRRAPINVLKMEDMLPAVVRGSKDRRTTGARVSAGFSL